MLKKSLAFIVLFIGATFFSYAQKSKVTAGAMALNNREYEKAITYLKEALSKPQLLKPRDMAKANAKLFQAYVYYISSSARKNKILMQNILIWLMNFTKHTTKPKNTMKKELM